MANVLLLPELRSMLAEGDKEGLTALMTELHPATVADWTEDLTVEETWAVFNHAGIDRQAEVFGFFPIKKQVEMATGAGRERMSRLIEAMAHDERVDLLKRLDPEVVENLLPLVAKADRQDIRTLLSYPEHSAGSVMTTEYATLTADLTVNEAISRLRLQATSAETIYYVYVVDDQRHLIGFVSLHDLILARPMAKIESIMQREVISVRVDADQEDIAQTMARYDFLAIPVVDAENRLVGIVTHDDVMDVVVQEATEDALRMGGVGSMVERYLDVPFVTLWRKRSVWLACLFVAELFTFSALAYYENAIASIIALSLFVPLCISTGGNSGSQAATLITRAMALRQISPADWLRVLKHELGMGIALGVTLGLIGFVRASLTPAAVLGGADRWLLALVIGQSVAAICLWGTLVGSTLPLLFARLRVDPGYASSPFVATFVDVTGIVIYFTIATIYLAPAPKALDARITLPTSRGDVTMTFSSAGNGPEGQLGGSTESLRQAGKEVTSGESLTVDGRTATLFEMHDAASRGDRSRAVSERTLLVAVPLESRSLYVKLAGPDAAVRDMRDAFREFARTARLGF